MIYDMGFFWVKPPPSTTRALGSLLKIPRGLYFNYNNYFLGVKVDVQDVFGLCPKYKDQNPTQIQQEEQGKKRNLK